ncbi:hypothetical protein DPMN_144626 [Dreissena polymorpha]|uniref:Uncharacterized protein n=1 Tax=Dreissena polymorpha TaxID=45954 RepID=A0A9D4F4E3_DREPO|nr:hypothetical protein DPMN_144626 [Dreissena polymorpha]
METSSDLYSLYLNEKLKELLVHNLLMLTSALVEMTIMIETTVLQVPISLLST